MIGHFPNRLNLDEYQVIVIHYSLIIAKTEWLSSLSKSKIFFYKGLKVVFIQDEYRWVNKTIETLKFLDVDVLYTVVPKNQQEKVYPKSELPGLRLETTLTGFVPSNLADLDRSGFLGRPIDIGYRGRKISCAYGRLGQEKQLIAEGFSTVAEDYALKSDIAYGESDRLYGDKWISFISNCKSMLGTESGANVFDFEGTIIPAVENAENANPELSFEELETRYFPGLDGRIVMNQISPRCFECAALGTLMVLFEGSYSGILSPWEHFVPLKKDFSNSEEVVDAIMDEEIWGRITTQAYKEIACNRQFSFEKFEQDSCSPHNNKVYLL